MFIQKFIEHFNIADLGLNKDELIKIWENKSQREKIKSRSKGIVINSVTLVKNQEDNISESIRSANLISDNIYIFDTGSTDRTLEVVKELQTSNTKIHVMSIPWKENFSYMRNTINNLVPNGWIFCIDSDESIINQLEKDFLNLSLSLIETICIGDDISLSFKQVGGDSKVINWAERLYRKSDTLTFFGYVHEEPRSSINLFKIKTQFTLMNLGRLEEQREKFNKEERYYRLLLKNIKIEPNNIKWIALMPFNEGIKNIEYYTQQLEKFALPIINSSNVLEGTYETFFEETLIINYTKLLIKKNEFDKALAILLFSKKLYPANTAIIFIYYYLINILIQKNSIIELMNLQSDIKILKKNENIWNSYESTEEFEYIITKLLFKSEHFEEAMNIIKEKIDKNNSDFLSDDFKIFWKFL